jgi:hypothetical protein
MDADAHGFFKAKTGARASARFNAGKPIDFRPMFGNRKLKRRKRRSDNLSLRDSGKKSRRQLFQNALGSSINETGG